MLALNGTTSARIYIRNCYNRNLDIGVVGGSKDVLKGAVFTLVEQKNINTFKALLIR
jgi:hypothetical protein